MYERTQIQAKIQAQASSLPAGANLLQRKCVCGGRPGIDGECAECRNTRMQRSSANQAEHSEAPSIVHEVLSSPAEPLDVGTREFMEPRFGHDFSKVRVHSDAGSAESARVLNAQAYSVGQDLVFGAEQYAPDTRTGQHLLAHELAHVVQQTRGGMSAPAPLPDSTLERAADQAASTLSQGSEQVTVTGTSAPGLARQATLLNLARDPSILSNEELEQEIDLIRQWLLDNPVSSPENDQLMAELEVLENEVRRRTPSAPEARPVAQPTGEATISGDPGALLAGAANIVKFRSLVGQYEALLNSGTLSAEEVAEVNEAISRANTALRAAEQAGGAAPSVALGGVAVGLAADDATVVGVFDDVAIPFALLAAWMLSRRSAHEVEQTGEAARGAVAEAILTIGQIVLAQKVGEQVRGLTNQIVIHLARILGSAVGGQPPDHQQDPEKDRPHWWKEIKNFIQQIRDKGLTPKQLLRELGKRFSPEQLAEIREALRRAAEMLREDPPDFPPAAL